MEERIVLYPSPGVGHSVHGRTSQAPPPQPPRKRLPIRPQQRHTSALTLISKTSTIKAFVIDLFCTAAMDAASSMGIPVYYFFTSGAAVLALLTYFPTIHNQTNQSLKDLKVELRVPGNEPLSAWLMPEPVLDREDPAYWDMLYCCSHLPKSSGIIVNTFQELEPDAVKAIEEGLCFPDPKQRPPVYYIGPLIADSNHDQQAGLVSCLFPFFSILFIFIFNSSFYFTRN